MCSLCPLCAASQERFPKNEVLFNLFPVSIVSSLSGKISKKGCIWVPRSFDYAKSSESTANGVLRCQDTLLFHIEWSVWVPRVAGRDPLAQIRIPIWWSREGKKMGWISWTKRLSPWENHQEYFHMWAPFSKKYSRLRLPVKSNLRTVQRRNSIGLCATCATETASVTRFQTVSKSACVL